MPVKFRASSVGNLMVGGNEPTEKQKERLRYLQVRTADPEQKPLTDKMESERLDLIKKRDAQFELGATSKSYVKSVWLAEEYGYDEPVLSNEMLKGIMCEDAALGVLTRQVPGAFRVKNEVRFSNECFTGTPDSILDDVIEDVKCSWTVKTFVDVDHPSAIYYAQLQVYMDLVGRDVARLVYVLVQTPHEIILEEQKRFYFRFNCDEEHPRYIECYNAVERMHDISKIPEEQRIKVYTIERNDVYLMKLRKRVALAREFYDTLSLKG